MKHALLCFALLGSLAAQGAALDREKQPPAAESRPTRIPEWTRAKLTNGAELIVCVKKGLPLVSLSVGFVGGSSSYEPFGKVGVASFTAQMLSEGTATKTADEFSDAQQLLGISINAGVAEETGALGFTALKDRFDPAVALLADMMLHPKLPADALERIRGRALVGLQQARDQPGAIAVNVFNKITYGEEHPYGRVTTESGLKSITRDDIIAFHRAFYTPGHAIITVAGDVEPAAVKATLEKALAEWPAGGAKPDFKYPAPPERQARKIYLVDKPKAAQSVFRLGHTGPDRFTPDYYALQVMNTIVGGLFQSRLNHDIREVKGYSYGVRSVFAYGRGPGAFTAGGGIVTDKSDKALILFMNHLKGAQGDEPFTDEEIRQGKDALVQSLPESFASVGGVLRSISTIYLSDLPENYYQEFAAKVNAVTKEDLARVAKKYLDLDKMNLVIVGDRAVIEEALRKTGIAPVVLLDVDAKPVIEPGAQTVTPPAEAAPSTSRTNAPATRRGGGGGGRGGPAVVVEPLASAETVELAPPLDKTGNFKHAPRTSWQDVPGIAVKPGTPRGTVTMFKVPGADSKLFPGDYQRNVWVYVPAGYQEGTELPFMVDHDGSSNAVVQTQLIATMDQFIAQKKIPMMAGVFIAPARRSVEYDTVSGKYCEYIENEILPLVEQKARIKLTKDPEGRGAIGQSSGGAAAFTMAWFHPELCRRVVSYSGSFTRLQRNATYPQGAWGYHQTIIPAEEKKPIRIWMQVGSNDLNNQFGDWRVANNNMAEALKAKGYEYQYLWSEGARHVEGGVERQTMEEAMEWVWKTYQAK